MKRWFVLVCCALMVMALLAGCGCSHEWQDATCDTPKTCKLCSETEGEALGHNWKDATTDAPKTCVACQKTEGERIITDPRFKTSACKPLFGTWEANVSITGEMMNLDGFEGALDIAMTIVFTNDGKITIDTEVKKPEEFKASLKAYMIEAILVELENSGVSRDDADAAMKQSAGMTVEEYVDAMMKVIDFAALVELVELEGYYYVEGNKLYAARSWEEEMEPAAFTLVDGKLTIPDLLAEGSFERVEVQEG